MKMFLWLAGAAATFYLLFRKNATKVPARRIVGPSFGPSIPEMGNLDLPQAEPEDSGLDRPEGDGAGKGDGDGDDREVALPANPFRIEEENGIPEVPEDYSGSLDDFMPDGYDGEDPEEGDPEEAEEGASEED